MNSKKPLQSAGTLSFVTIAPHWWDMEITTLHYFHIITWAIE